MFLFQGYTEISPETVWEAIGDDSEVSAWVENSDGKFRPGFYDVDEMQVNTLLDLIDEDNVKWFIKPRVKEV